jgi:hypothetical protein
MHGKQCFACLLAPLTFNVRETAETGRFLKVNVLTGTKEGAMSRGQTELLLLLSVNDSLAACERAAGALGWTCWDCSTLGRYGLGGIGWTRRAILGLKAG